MTELDNIKKDSILSAIDEEISKAEKNVVSALLQREHLSNQAAIVNSGKEAILQALAQVTSTAKEWSSYLEYLLGAYEKTVQNGTFVPSQNNVETDEPAKADEASEETTTVEETPTEVVEESKEEETAE